MRKLKLTASHLVCLALVVIAVTLAMCGGRTYLLILLPISIGVCMPFYSLGTTGRFTYLPPIQSIEVPTPNAQQTMSPAKTEKFQKPSDSKNKEYDLRDIPYPPKRKSDTAITNLPYGKGLSPQKQAGKVFNPRCALLGPKPPVQAGAQSPGVPIGETLQLFPNADSPSTQEPEEVFVQQDCIFL